MKLIRYILFGSLFVGAMNSAHAVVIQSEAIQTSPASADNLWRYSYQSSNTLITSAASFASDASHWSSAVFQGYVAAPDSSNPRHLVTSGGLSDFRTGHVMSTYVRSSIDQAITVIARGDDGHSIFLDGMFQSGGGFGTGPTATINLVANVSYRVDWVGYNYGGPWGHAFGIWDGGNGFAGDLQSVANLAFNAENEFAPVSEPATFALLALGLAGIGFGRRLRRL